MLFGLWIQQMSSLIITNYYLILYIESQQICIILMIPHHSIINVQNPNIAIWKFNDTYLEIRWLLGAAPYWNTQHHLNPDVIMAVLWTSSQILWLAGELTYRDHDDKSTQYTQITSRIIPHPSSCITYDMWSSKLITKQVNN